MGGVGGLYSSCRYCLMFPTSAECLAINFHNHFVVLYFWLDRPGVLACDKVIQCQAGYQVFNVGYSDTASRGFK